MLFRPWVEEKTFSNLLQSHIWGHSLLLPRPNSEPAGEMTTDHLFCKVKALQESWKFLHSKSYNPQAAC